MVRLEDLKIGDEIFHISENGVGLYAPSVVYEEILMLDVYPEPCEAVLCKGGHESISRKSEKYIFRTKKEAEEASYGLRLKLAKELLKSDRFIDKLFACATSAKRLNTYYERPIYDLAVKIYKEDRKMMYNE